MINVQPDGKVRHQLVSPDNFTVVGAYHFFLDRQQRFLLNVILIANPKKTNDCPYSTSTMPPPWARCTFSLLPITW